MQNTHLKCIKCCCQNEHTFTTILLTQNIDHLSFSYFVSYFLTVDIGNQISEHILKASGKVRYSKMLDYCHINLSIGFGWLWDCVQKFPTILCCKLPLSGSLFASIKGDFFTYMSSVSPLLRCDYRHVQADHPALLLIDLPCSHNGNHLVTSSMNGTDGQRQSRATNNWLDYHTVVLSEVKKNTKLFICSKNWRSHNVRNI